MKDKHYDLLGLEYKITDDGVYFKHMSGHWVKSVYEVHELLCLPNLKKILTITEKFRERLND